MSRSAYLVRSIASSVVAITLIALIAACGGHPASASSPWQSLGQTDNVTSIAFSDGSHGWAVSVDEPGVQATSDGGRTWRPCRGAIAGASRSLGSLPPTVDRLPLPDQVICTGRNIFVSYCGQSPGTFAAPPADVRSGIIVSADGGATWSRCLSLAPTTDSVLVLAAGDAMHLWALCGAGKPDQVGATYLLRSSDGGRTWVRLATKDVFVGGFGLMNKPIVFTDAVHGWSLYGRYSTGSVVEVRTTSDAGQTWTGTAQPEAEFVWGIATLDARHAWVAGSSLSEQSGGALDVTADGGTTWHQDATFSHIPLSSVFFSDVNHGWVIASRNDAPGGAIYATADGGRSWTKELSSSDSDCRSPWVFCRAGDKLVATNGFLLLSRSLP
jgi:photosystem II stability/assembly factor-like uncharacterized protein